MVRRLFIRGVLLVCAVPVLLVTGGLGWRALRRHQISDAMAVHTPHGIDEHRYVRIGGVEQWITIRGQDRNNPAVLVLHGGPGAPVSPLPAHFLPWERDFTVIQWDQRRAGKSSSMRGWVRGRSSTCRGTKRWPMPACSPKRALVATPTGWMLCRRAVLRPIVRFARWASRGNGLCVTSRVWATDPSARRAGPGDRFLHPVLCGRRRRGRHHTGLACQKLFRPDHGAS